MGLFSKFIASIFRGAKTAENATSEPIMTVPGALDELNVALGGAAGAIKPTDAKVHALQKIYKTLGGEEDVKGILTTSQMIQKIATVATPGGAELPTLIKINMQMDSDDYTTHYMAWGFDENLQPQSVVLSMSPTAFYYPIMGGAVKRAVLTLNNSTAGSSNVINGLAVSTPQSWTRPELVELPSNKKYGALFINCNVTPANAETTITLAHKTT